MIASLINASNVSNVAHNADAAIFWLSQILLIGFILGGIWWSYRQQKRKPKPSPLPVGTPWKKRITHFIVEYVPFCLCLWLVPLLIMYGTLWAFRGVNAETQRVVGVSDYWQLPSDLWMYFSKNEDFAEDFIEKWLRLPLILGMLAAIMAAVYYPGLALAKFLDSLPKSPRPNSSHSTPPTHKDPPGSMGAAEGCLFLLFAFLEASAGYIALALVALWALYSCANSLHR